MDDFYYDDNRNCIAIDREGRAAIPIFDALVDSGVKLILTRHEQGAAHMADGYARATGKPGVVLVTSGPGATNWLDREGPVRC